MQAEVRKKEEKEAAEALKREQELRDERRKERQLNYLIKQTEIFSHFMQKKAAQASESLPVEDGETDNSELQLGASPVGEEDPEDAEMNKEALRAAQDAVSKQKKLTTEFDTECLKLRQAADIEASQDISVAGSSNIDLDNP